MSCMACSGNTFQYSEDAGCVPGARSRFQLWPHQHQSRKYIPYRLLSYSRSSCVKLPQSRPSCTAKPFRWPRWVLSVYCIPKAFIIGSFLLSTFLEPEVYVRPHDRAYHIAMICVVEIGFEGWPCTGCAVSESPNIASSIFAESRSSKGASAVCDQDAAK